VIMSKQEFTNTALGCTFSTLDVSMADLEQYDMLRNRVMALGGGQAAVNFCSALAVIDAKSWTSIHIPSIEAQTLEAVNALSEGGAQTVFWAGGIVSKYMVWLLGDRTGMTFDEFLMGEVREQRPVDITLRPLTVGLLGKYDDTRTALIREGRSVYYANWQAAQLLIDGWNVPEIPDRKALGEWDQISGDVLRMVVAVGDAVVFVVTDFMTVPKSWPSAPAGARKRKAQPKRKKTGRPTS